MFIKSCSESFSQIPNWDVKRLETLTDRDATRIAKYLRAWRSLNFQIKNEVDTDNPTIESDENHEPPVHSKEKPCRKLTPEQEARLKETGDRLSRAIIDGLHKDNQEIFGEDYIEK